MIRNFFYKKPILDQSGGVEYAFTMSANDTQATGEGGLVHSVSARTATPGYEAWKAFNTDLDYNNSWYATDAFTTTWLQVRFNSARVVRRYDVSSTNYSGPTYGSYSPRDWTFEGSNDGSAWTTLDSRTAQTAWAMPTQTRSYTFSNSTAYTYYRINISNNTGADGNSNYGSAYYTFFGRLRLYS